MEAEGKEEDLHKPMNNFPSPLEMQIVPFSLIKLSFYANMKSY